MARILKSVSWTCLGLLLGGCAGPLKWLERGTVAETKQEKLAMDYFVKAKVFEFQGNYYGAIVALRSAADLDPSSPTIYERLAWDYNRIRDYKTATHFARKALQIDPQRPELHYLLFQLQQIEGDTAGAIEALESMLEVQPDHWRLYFQLGQLYMESGKGERIEGLFQRALDRPDASAQVKVNIADIFARAGRRGKAERIYHEVLEENPVVEDAWLGLGDLKKAVGDTAGAAEWYRLAARSLPRPSMAFRELARLIRGGKDLDTIIATEDVEFLYELGNALSSLEKYSQAAHVFEQIVGRRPDSAEEWLDLARYYLSLNETDRVEDVLTQAAASMPDSSRIFLFWGLSMERAERFDRAEEIYHQGLASNPGDAALYLYLGLLRERARDGQGAIANYSAGLQEDPTDPDLHIRWGIALGREGRWVESIEHYELAAGLDLTGSTVLLHWGIALEKLGRWPEAIQKLSQAVELDEENTSLLFYLGSCFEQASRNMDVAPLSDGAPLLDGDLFDSAVETFEKLLELDPEDPYALNYLGYMLADRGVRLQEAAALIKRAIALEPGKMEFLDSMGWVYYRLGDLENAERYLRQALKMLEEGGEEQDEFDVEERSVILEHAGDIARSMGKENEARRHWGRALELNPGNQTILEKLERRVP